MHETSYPSWRASKSCVLCSIRSVYRRVAAFWSDIFLEKGSSYFMFLLVSEIWFCSLLHLRIFSKYQYITTFEWTIFVTIHLPRIWLDASESPCSEGKELGSLRVFEQRSGYFHRNILVNIFIGIFWWILSKKYSGWYCCRKKAGEYFHINMADRCFHRIVTDEYYQKNKLVDIFVKIWLMFP